MSKRNNQKQLWADELFINRLEDIRAKAQLMKRPFNNMGELTKAIAESKSFQDLENEILNYDPLNNKKSGMNIKIKFDGLL